MVAILDDDQLDFDLPETAKLLGFVIHLPRTDEFMFSSRNTATLRGWTWIGTPGNAKRFPSWEAATQELDMYGHSKGAVIGQLYDLGDRFGVVFEVPHA